MASLPLDGEMRLRDRRAIITGGASGIGLASDEANYVTSAAHTGDGGSVFD
ncbi:hypothetical protein JYK14_07330 [Siccirubricoccus sp. KC 17139]|uniref:Short-chain dehydrogenase n=1 Tax=Siccirubricoccus soli TaxID=2899147 RepID=A0ABT1D246_9PROT|nr:hypothetical protein [Siccirubricoccus soli]MCO6415986.1 hypothetical protein [Siccirubricoccus soli]MCP2682118.1 hypothetical protein [Siccirubricoccus soli]